MPFGPRTILAAVATAAIALAAGGCGSSDDASIPPTSSDQLLAQLDGVQDQVENGDCELAKSGAIRFKSSVDSLPSDVQADTKKDLNQLADNLIELTNDPGQCAQEGATQSGVTTTDTSTTEEPTTTTSTTSSTTEEDTTEAQPSEPEQTEQQNEGSQGDQGSDTGSNIGGGGTGAIGIKPGGGGG